MEDNKLVRSRYKALKTISGFRDWFHATYVLFLAERGLNQLQINSINTFFMIGDFVFEPISGFVQDKLGQIQIYWFGLFFWVLSFVTYYNGQVYWHFVVAELLGAVGLAAIVGSLEAFLDNKLGPIEAKKVRADGRSLQKLIEMIPATLGAFAAARWGLGFPWLLSAVCTLIVLIVSIFLLKPLLKIPEKEQLIEQKYEIKLKPLDVLKFVFQDYRLIAVMISSFIAKFVFMAYNMTWTLIFAEQFDAKFIGLLWIGVSITTMIGFQIAKRVPNTLLIILVSLVAIGGVMFFGSIQGSIWVLLITFYVHELFRALFHESIESYAALRIPNKIRSSTRSVLDTASRLGAVLGLPFTGWLGDRIGLIETWRVMSLSLFLIAVIGVIILLIIRSKNNSLPTKRVLGQGSRK